MPEAGVAVDAAVVHAAVERPGKTAAVETDGTPRTVEVETVCTEAEDDIAVVHAAVDNPGTAVTVGIDGGAMTIEVETAGAPAVGAVPDETVWAEAEDDSNAAARMLMRSLFTGNPSIQNRLRPRGKREAGPRGGPPFLISVTSGV